MAGSLGTGPQSALAAAAARNCSGLYFTSIADAFAILRFYKTKVLKRNQVRPLTLYLKLKLVP